MINDNLLKGKWTEIKGDIQKAWGNLTGDELDKTKGDATAVAGLVQQKYGIAQEEARTKVNDLFIKYSGADKDISTKTKN